MTSLHSETGCHSIAIDLFFFTFLQPYRLFALRCNDQNYMISPLAAIARESKKKTTLTPHTHIQTHDLLSIIGGKK